MWFVSPPVMQEPNFRNSVIETIYSRELTKRYRKTAQTINASSINRIFARCAQKISRTKMHCKQEEHK